MKPQLSQQAEARLNRFFLLPPLHLVFRNLWSRETLLWFKNSYLLPCKKEETIQLWVSSVLSNFSNTILETVKIREPGPGPRTCNTPSTMVYWAVYKPQWQIYTTSEVQKCVGCQQTFWEPRTDGGKVFRPRIVDWISYRDQMSCHLLLLGDLSLAPLLITSSSTSQWHESAVKCCSFSPS